MKQQILGAAAPNKECTDRKCPFHGEIDVKPELFKGKVIKKDISRSATLEWLRPFYIPKYERYEIRRSRMRAHNPMCINAQIGEEVLVAKTRPLSKTKHHVIIQILKSEEETSTGTPKKSATAATSFGSKKEKSARKKVKAEAGQEEA